MLVDDAEDNLPLSLMPSSIPASITRTAVVPRAREEIGPEPI